MRFIIPFAMTLLAVAMVGSIGVLQFDVLNQIYDNEKEIGFSITDAERDCLEFCKPNKYYYSAGGLFSSSSCTCGQVRKNG